MDIILRPSSRGYHRYKEDALLDFPRLTEHHRRSKKIRASFLAWFEIRRCLGRGTSILVKLIAQAYCSQSETLVLRAWGLTFLRSGGIVGRQQDP